MTRGGKREGAGRPPAPPRPSTMGWRPDSDEQKAYYMELGGSRWLKRILNELREKKIVIVENPGYKRDK